MLKIKNWFVSHKTVFQSWALYTSIAALAGYVIYHATGVDLSDAFATYMAFLLPVLVAFGIINDPGVRGKLGLETGMQWYQSKTVWAAIIALVAYTVKNLFGVDLGTYLNGLSDTLLPIMMMLGIVKSPALTTP